MKNKVKIIAIFHPSPKPAPKPNLHMENNLWCHTNKQTNKQTTRKRAQAEPASMPLKTKLN